MLSKEKNLNIMTQNNFRFNLRRLFTDNGMIAFLLVILLFIIGPFIVHGFSSFHHIMTVLQTSSFLGLICLGQTIVIISGEEGLDLSVGGMFVIGVNVGALILNGHDSNLPLALVSVLAMGFALGLVNGIGISYFRIAPLIMTLAWGIAVRGILLFTTKGVQYGNASPILEIIGNGNLNLFGLEMLSIPWVVIIWAGVIILSHLILNRTTFGYILYAIGANNRAAQLIGIKTKRFRMLVYGISGMMAAFSGLIMLGYVGTPNINLGEVYVFNSVVAVVIGGVALTGGSGHYIGAVAGAIFLTTLSSILTTLQLSDAGRLVIIGSVLLIMLMINSRQEKNS
jgi:ribose transport system permease protein